MDRQSSPSDSVDRVWRLDREEAKLWRLVLLFIALLAVGMAAALWDNLSQISIRFGFIPLVAACFALALAFYAGQQRRRIAELRNDLRRQEHPLLPASDGNIEQLVDIIRRSQRGFRELVDSFDDVVLAISLDGLIQAANRTFADLLGMGFPDFVYRSVAEFIEHPTAEDVKPILCRLVEHHHWSGILEVRFRHDPSPRYFDCAIRTILKEGRVTGVSIWGREVTEQHQREARFTDLFDTLHEAVYFTKPDGTLLDANPSLVNMLGFTSKSELLSVPITDMYVDLSERARILTELNRQGSLRDYEIRLRRRDGTEISCIGAARAIYDAGGQVEHYQGTLVDITERRRMANQLLEQQQFNQRLFECFPDAILVVDTEMRYTFASARMREILGWEPEDIIGRPVTSNGDSSEPARLYRDILSGTEKVGSVEFAAQHRNGTWKTLRCTASPLLDHDGAISGVVGSVRDVTESKQIEQQLVQAERLAAMGQMIDGFAHELNNPLTAIVGAIDLLDSHAQAASVKHVKLLKGQARRAVEIVQNLLFFSRPPSRGTTRLNLNDLIQRTLLLHQYSLRLNGITVDFLPEHSLPHIEGDANQLMQVFLNLLMNAEQAIRSVHDRGTVRVRIGRNDRKVWVSFQDDGPGIPEGKLQNIFDPFYSTKRPGGGTGMGLSVALGIVKGYGGDIDFQAAPGNGAVFTVQLPVTAMPQPTPELMAVSTSVH